MVSNKLLTSLPFPEIHHALFGDKYSFAKCETFFTFFDGPGNNTLPRQEETERRMKYDALQVLLCCSSHKAIMIHSSFPGGY